MTHPRPLPFPLTCREDIADPYPRYRAQREADPVHRVPAGAGGGADVWYLFGYQDVAQVLAGAWYGRSARTAATGIPAPADVVPARFRTLHEVVSNWLVFLDPPRHTRLRARVAAHFSGQRVRRLRPRIQAIAADLLAALRARPSIDLVADFAAPLPILVISELLGVDPRDRVWLRERAVALQEANSSRSSDPDHRHATAEQATQALHGYFLDLVCSRRSRPQGDLISALAQAGDDGASLTDEEITGSCIHLLTAGHETTTNLLAKGTLALLTHPAQLAELRTDAQLMPNAVDELIRYDTPVQMISRWVYRDDVVGGRAISRGSRLVLVLGSANRDPERFPDPDRLDLRRPVGRHWGFGGGIHYCVGAQLAHLEAEIGLATLLTGLPDLALGDEPVSYADDLVFHGPDRLPLRTGVVRR